MAQVNVDLSEYDMLRESKKKAEEEVKELKAEIEEYKKNARVIITTKKCYRLLNANAVAKVAINHYLSCKRSLLLSPSYEGLDAPEKIEKMEMDMLERAIEYGIHATDNSDNYKPFPSDDYLTKYESSTEIKGFDDVRLKVEETFKEEYKRELECKLAEAKASKEKYEKAYNEALAKANKELDCQYKFEIERLNTTISQQDGFIKIYKKENLALKKERADLQQELEMFKTKRETQNKPWYKKLF